MSINATLLGQMLVFAMLVWFTMKFVWPVLLKAMEEREAKIADGLAAAERGRHELELAGEKSAETMREGKDKAQEFINQAHKRADEIIGEAKVTAKAEGERIKIAAQAEVEQQANRAREALRSRVAELAVAGAEQILLREVDAAAHHEVLDKLATEL